MPTRPHSVARARMTSTAAFKSAARTTVSRGPGPEHQDALTWRFQRTPDGHWQWRKIDANQRVACESERSFATYETCIEDAAGAGYKPMLEPDNLVPLSLSADAPPIPRILALSLDDLSPVRAKHSAVLKKRVAHPAIERIFGKSRAAAVTRTRTAVFTRASTEPACNHPQSRGKKLKRA